MKKEREVLHEKIQTFIIKSSKFFIYIFYVSYKRRKNMIQSTQNYHVVTLPQNPQRPDSIVKQAIDDKTGEVLGTLKADISRKTIYPKGKIHINSLVSTDEPIQFAKPHINVADLFVRKESRHKGVGTALIIDTVKESKARGFMGRLILLAGSNEESPLPFYKKLGFITTNNSLNKKLDYAVRYRAKISNSIQEFMTLSATAAKKLLKAIQ